MRFRFSDDLVPRFCERCGTLIVNMEEARDFLVTGEGRVPFRCERGHETWKSPLPIGLMALFVDTDLVLVRRGIRPGYGELALVGGHQNPGERIRDTALREMREEIACILPPGEDPIYVGDAAPPASPFSIQCYAFHWRTREHGPCVFTPDGTETLEAVKVPAHRVPPLAFRSHEDLAPLAARVVGVL